ncbi:MAG: hypothetical protein LQ338_003402 [Usnochroma carphineum]|nr:MAG: hypothetical protein LQ338_003402 [Usnochroma carphineum]
MSARSNFSAAKQPFGPSSYASSPGYQPENGGQADAMDTGVNGTNGAHAPEAEMSSLTTQHQPVGSRKPSGHANGINSRPKYGFDRPDSHSTVTSHAGEQQITILKETVIVTCQKFIADFDEVDERYIHSMTIEEYFEYIERQRLTHMPHRGSHWDKVLKWAEFFGLQISSYVNTVEPFLAESKPAVRLIWTACRALLQLGPENAQALQTTFAAFYKLGLSIAFLLRRHALLTASEYLRYESGYSLNELLILVRDVSLYYRAKLFEDAHESAFDFNTIFGPQMSGFSQRKTGIVNAMWEHVLGPEASTQIQDLRKWLQPGDRTLRKLLLENEAAAGRRDEFTCEWFQSHLLAFSRSRDDVLSLQGPLGKKVYDTISCTVEPDVAGEDPAAVAKRLLLQLLDKNVGNQDFFRALVEAHRATQSKDSESAEGSLWKCIDIGLDQYRDTDHLMIVVDGLDDFEGGQQQASNVANHLTQLASKHRNTQAIFCSRSAVSKSKHGNTRSFVITSDHTHEDLRLVIDNSLKGYPHFDHQSEHAQEKIAEQLVHAAKGNFLWAILTAFVLKHQSTHDGFNKELKAVSESPKSIDENIAKLLSAVDLSKADTHILLSWMLIADRPLTVAEITVMSQVDLSKKSFVERDTNAIRDVLAILRPFISQKDGFVRFRHSIVRQYMLNIQKEGKRFRNPRDAQADFTMRLLAYCHLNLPKSHEPAFEVMKESEMDDLFTRHRLLDYAVVHWLHHFRRSSFQQDNGALQLSADFKTIFPGAASLPLLEWSCWGSAESSPEVLRLHELALRVRQEVLTQNHRCVLQGLIICGEAYRSKHQAIEAGGCFYRASKISQHILRKHHAFAIACTTTFLTVTESLTISSRTEVATWKEELLIYIIDTYKHQHGKTHDLVIRYYKMLAQLYTDIHEEHNAERVWREVREIIIIRFGKGSKEETSVAEHLTIVLKNGDKKTDVIEYEQGIIDLVTELEVWDIRRIRMTLDLATSYEKRGEILMAEELFVVLWGRLTDQCHHHHHHHGIDIHIRTIDVVIEYVHFLRRCNRHEEAANVLICIWSEYEEYDFETETIFLRLQMIGQLLREISLLSIAVSVLKKCWAWFKSHGKHEHAKSCEIIISETILEIVTSVSTTTSITTSTTTTTSTGVVVREIFESTVSRTTVTSEMISVCRSLISWYMKLEQWSEAIEVSRKSLLVIWKSILSDNGTIALPRDFGTEAIEMAIHLAICHHESHQFHEVEEIYVRIYHACRNSCRIDDERLGKACGVLVKFHEEHRHWRKVIEIYQEMLVEYRAHLGHKHHLTIQMLYLLGSLCTEHGHGNGYEYYEEIIMVFDDGSHTCHPDALEAMMFMCGWHYEAGHWHKLRTVCKILWDTWRHQHAGHEKFTADFVEVLYLRYHYLLEHHVHVEYSMLRELTIEYRHACVKAFGVSAAITLKALIELAHFSTRMEKYAHEAISLYEEVLTHVEATSKTTTKSTTITTTTITQVRERLTQAYLQVCSHESVSTQTIERAIKVVLHRYAFLRSTLGWAHVETLSCLREVIHLHIKLKKQESVTVAQRMLVEATIEIIIREKHSKTLHEAGKIVGQIFTSCGFASYAHDIIHELRLQIITGSATLNNKLGIKLDKAVGRVSFVFLVTLEQIIGENLSISYAEVMADYITESVLYESYAQSLRGSSRSMLGHAARLRAFLHRHKRQSQVEKVEEQSFEIFVKTWSLSAQPHIRKLFYISLLEQIGAEVREVNVGDVACRSSVAKVTALLKHDRTQEAYEVAHCAFHFVKEQRSYQKLENVHYGFKLSGLVVGHGLDVPMRVDVDSKLHHSMRQLSQEIIREVLKCCKESKIDFVRLPLSDLNGLIALLGEQQNYADLEWILELLWKSREVQKNWRPDTIIEIGCRFVQARYLNASKGRRSEAIRLCEDICYNLRRVWGSHPKTLEMSNLLSQLYTNMGHYREAQGLHENNLRLIVEGDDGDDRTLDTMDSQTAYSQVELLKQSYLRLRGWDKSPEIYKDLIHDLKQMPEYKSEPEWKDVRPANEWKLKESASETLGTFQAPKMWYLVRPDKFNEKGEVIEIQPKGPRMHVKRATSNWGMNFVHNLMHEHHKNGVVAKSNGVEKQAGMKKDGEEGGYESAAEEML